MQNARYARRVDSWLDQNRVTIWIVVHSSRYDGNQLGFSSVLTPNVGPWLAGNAFVKGYDKALRGPYWVGGGGTRRTHTARRLRDRDVGPRGNSRRALTPWVLANQQSASGYWGFHTVPGAVDPRDLRFRPKVVGVVEIRNDLFSGVETLSSPGAAGLRRWSEGKLSPYAGSMNPSQSATSQWGWSFHTVRGGIDPGDLRFRPRVVGVVEIWKNCWSGDGKLYSPGAAGPRWPEGRLSPHADSMSPSESAISQWGWGFHTVRGYIDPRDHRFSSRVVGIVDICNDLRLWSGDRNLSSPGCAGFILKPQTISDRPVGLGFLPCGAVSTRRIAVFVPRLPEL